MSPVTRPARRHIDWWLRFDLWWLLIGNADDGLHGAGTAWNPTAERSLRRALGWWLRNPLHNLTWYVLGVADQSRSIIGPRAGEFHTAGPGWLWSITLIEMCGYRAALAVALVCAAGVTGSWTLFTLACVIGWVALALPLPYLSYQSKSWRGYLGWRPSGAFGVKWQRRQT